MDQSAPNPTSATPIPSIDQPIEGRDQLHLGGVSGKKASRFSIKAIIGAIIFLLLAGGAAAGYVYREPLMTLVSQPTPTPTVSFSPTPTPVDPSIPLKELLTYQIPSGWTEKVTDNYIKVESPETAFNPLANEHTSATGISIVKLGTLENLSFEKRYENKQQSRQYPEVAGATQNLTKTFVGSFQALSYINTVEGYSKNYEIRTNSEWLFISAASLDSKYFNKYLKEIDDFMSSITFTDSQTVDTSTWKTYKGEGFSFKHPPEWYERKSADSSIVFGPMSTQGLGKDDKVDPYVSSVVWFYKINSLNKTSLIDYLQISEGIKSSAKTSSITVDGVNATDIHHVGCQSGNCRDVLLQKGQFIYRFFEQNKKKELDFILSTFKFTY